jgi:hypothetical protein
MSAWTEAFYDTDYGKDQTRRMAIFDDVFGFLKSIGCQPKWTCRYDGSDIDYDYGIIISTVAYNGRTYNHNLCPLRCLRNSTLTSARRPWSIHRRRSARAGADAISVPTTWPRGFVNSVTTSAVRRNASDRHHRSRPAHRRLRNSQGAGAPLRGAIAKYSADWHANSRLAPEVPDPRVRGDKQYSRECSQMRSRPFPTNG